MDATQIVELSRGIAQDTIPVGGGGEHSDAIMQVFEANRGKFFCGKDIKKLFADAGVEIKNPSNILFALMKAGKLERPKIGWYTAA